MKKEEVQKTDLDKMRADPPGNSVEESILINGVEYVVFVEYHNPEPTVGLDGGPQIEGIYRPSGEDLDGLVSDFVEDEIYCQLDEIFRESEEIRLNYLKGRGRE